MYDSPPSASQARVADVFPGDSEMAQRCRALDWSATSLGPVSGWSRSLRTAVSLVLASLHPMFLWWGPDLIQIYNDAYRPSFGAEGRHPAALGMRGRDCWRDIWDTIGPQIEQVMDGGPATWHEDQYLPIERNGHLEDVWWTYGYSAVRDDDGTVGGTLVVCQETTQRVHAETALRESEERYKTLFNSLDVGFAVFEVLFDAQGKAFDYRFIEANQAFERQSGLVGAMGRTVRELVPDLEEHWFETYGRVATTREPTRFESGSEAMRRWFDVYAFPAGRPGQGQVAVLFTDISSAKSAERERDALQNALEVERTRLAYAFQQAPSFLAVLRGRDHVFTLVNDAYYQLVGHREILGKPVWDALPEVRGQGFETLLDNVLDTGEPFIGREIPFTVLRNPDAPAEQRFIDLTYMPLVEGDGTRAGIIAHGADVTEQVRARQDVERLLAESERARAEAEAARGDAEAARGEAVAARQSAEEADRAKAEFLATMSHELRTPLNAIGGYAELLEMGIRGPTTEEQRHDLARIQQSQRHLLALVNEVLDLAKIDAGGLTVERAEVRAGDTVDAALALVRPQAAAKSLLISDHCGGAADRPYLGDEPRVRQVLVNLLANAVKFTPAGGRVTVECVVTDRPPLTVPVPAGAPCIAFRVIDTGVGIPKDQRDRIFEPFTQADAKASPYTRAIGGTGLGLTISRRLARLMGGDITLQSEVGSGSTFTLWLPTPERRATPRRPSEELSGADLRQKSEDAQTMAAGLAEIGEALTAGAANIAHAWVTRLRADPAVPDAGVSDQELEDHAITFIADVGLALRALGGTVVDPSEVLRDSRAILTVVAERHGAQRARLGWPEGVVMREFALLRETLDSAVRRAAAQPAGVELIERALGVVAQLIAQAERVSLGGLRLAGGAARASQAGES
jgi:signal transduction histidine kinase